MISSKVSMTKEIQRNKNVWNKYQRNFIPGQIRSQEDDPKSVSNLSKIII